jgi:transcriptional regulator with XRE-family HTH domain
MSEPQRQRRSRKESLRKELGAAVVTARRRRKWSQSELARRLKVSRERLSKWERGVHAPGLEEVALLSEVLGISFSDLGLGDAPEEALSSGELLELARSLVAMSRLLKPWLERLRQSGVTR